MISAFNLIGKYEPVEVIFYRGMLKRAVVFSLLSIPKLNGIYFHHMYPAWSCCMDMLVLQCRLWQEDHVQNIFTFVYRT